MVRSPRGRHRRTGDPTREQWLQVPGWRGPVDTLLVLAVTFATAWVGLVVISAAANDDATTVTANTHDASPPTVDPTTDPSPWIAGPVSTGRPAAPTTEQQVVVASVPVIAAPRTTAPRVDPEHTTHAGPRTTPPPAPGTTVAPAVAAAVTSGATTTDPTTTATTTPTATTTTAATTTPTETATPTATDTTSETPTTSATETTTSSPTTSSPAPAG